MTEPIADCERALSGLLVQPTNALTSLGFVVVALVVASRTPHRWLAIALAATGIGSFLSHGPMPPGSAWAHDVSLAWLLVAAGLAGTDRAWWSGWPTLVVLGIAFAVAPAIAIPVSVALAVVAIAAILWRARGPWTLGALALLAAGGILGRLSTTGAVLCDPDALVQGHGIWHLAAATAVGLWALRGVAEATPGRAGIDATTH